ncbi:ABC transporter ATP-binding protein [Microbacterium sp. MYb62]|uniref:ABC transporter ATP-binding protein n=1 Tax=Microbacterium sp. MYb62 TaxID=1848690 RepID=UPI000CFC9347|nr:ABC transporter ATP-binding protein [Microbacterium sp. MYb62]PRB18411.1 ABC transporter ATP-binding protein [Microbacterium sp. MYb62]
MTKILTLKNVSKTFTVKKSRAYSTTHALEDVSFDVEDGEFIAIIGASGCGKSTILRMIDGLDFPTRGEIRLRGEIVTGPGPDRGVVFQQPSLLPWRTVQRNIEFGLECNGMAAAERQDRVAQYVELVGLGGFEGHYPAQLSGGMQQRVGLARAYAVDPGILLLDEPFGALDAQTRVVLQTELERVWRAERKTTVLITHDMEEAVYLADRVIVMGNRPGRVTDIIDVPFGRPRGEELRASAEFGELKQQLWRALQRGMGVGVA